MNILMCICYVYSAYSSICKLIWLWYHTNQYAMYNIIKIKYSTLIILECNISYHDQFTCIVSNINCYILKFSNRKVFNDILIMTFYGQ